MLAAEALFLVRTLWNDHCITLDVVAGSLYQEGARDEGYLLISV